MPAPKRAASLGLLLAFVAACSSSNADDTGGSSSSASATGGTSNGGTSSGASATGGSGGTTPSGGAAETAGADNAGDTGVPTGPPYANVMAVAASGSDGSYTFNVTVESADIDCSQYANWWEVLSEDGALVYRRILDHSHTDANGTSDPDAPGNTFTRSGGPVPVAESDVVVVRAHMSVGGYNGRVMRGSVGDGFAEAPDLGSDFAAGVETEDPQPTSCEF